MSEIHKEDQDRWRELHELLGLPPEGSGGSVAPPASPTPEPSVLERQPESRREEPDVRSVPSQATVASDVVAEAPFAATENAIGDAPMGQEMAAEDDEAAEPSAPSVEDDSDRPQRGRRRGRRGRRGRSGRDENRAGAEESDSDPVTEGGGAAESPLADDELEDDSESGEDQALELVPAVNLEEDDDDEPIETFADWNVPSWQDIVASLYRPER